MCGLASPFIACMHATASTQQLRLLLFCNTNLSRQRTVYLLLCPNPPHHTPARRLQRSSNACPILPHSSVHAGCNIYYYDNSCSRKLFFCFGWILFSRYRQHPLSGASAVASAGGCSLNCASIPHHPNSVEIPLVVKPSVIVASDLPALLLTLTCLAIRCNPPYVLMHDSQDAPAT